jgi:DNA-binding NarL/FixJ family response regulator
MEHYTVQFRDPMNKERRFMPLMLSLCEDLPIGLARFKYLSYHVDPNSAVNSLIEACRQPSQNNFKLQDTANLLVQTCGILFVDDEEKTLKYFKKQIEPEHIVFTSQSVDEAMLLLGEKCNEIAVVISDQRLPNRRGVDFLAYVRDKHPRILRILISAYSDFESLVDAINIASIHGFLYKPWEINHLRLILRTAVNAYLRQDTSPAFIPPLPPTLKMAWPAGVHPHDLAGTHEITNVSPEQSPVIVSQASLNSKIFQELEQSSPTQIPSHETLNKNTNLKISDPFTEIVQQSIYPNLRTISQNLRRICTIINYDFPLIPFFPFYSCWERKLHERLNIIASNLDSFDTSIPVEKQQSVLNSLHDLGAVVEESSNEKTQLHSRCNQMIGVPTALNSVSKHYAIVASYLKLS